MEIFFDIAGPVIAALALIVAIAQYRRTPKLPESEPFTPICTTIMSVPVDYGPGLFGRREKSHWPLG